MKNAFLTFVHMSQKDVYIPNKRAKFEYHILDEYVAGIQLQGTEVKSIRNLKASIKEAYCVVQENEVFIRNMHIAEYGSGSYYNHNPRRDRKLLLNRQEIGRIEKKLKDNGVTLIPLSLFITKRGLVKIKIALGKGKKLHDKRHDLKEKDDKRSMDRVMKNYS